MSVRIFIILLSVVLTLAIQLGMWVGVERHKPESFLHSPTESRIYISSPVEEDLLEKHQRFWPRYFSESNNPQAHSMPGFYSFVAKNNEAIGLSNRSLEQVRAWSVLVNTGQQESLKESLHGSLAASPTEFKRALQTGPEANTTQDCQLLMRERAFRIAQSNSAFLKDAVKYLNRCEESEGSIATKYLEFQLVQNGDPKEKQKLLSALIAMSENPQLGYKRFLATRLARLLQFNLQHTPGS